MIQPPQVEPVQAETDGRHVPWGFGLSMGTMLLAFAIWFFGQIVISIPAVLVWGIHNLNQHVAFLGIAGYQFLTIGVITAVVVLLFSRYHVGPDTLGFRMSDPARLAAAVVVGVVAALVGVSLLYALFNAVFSGYHLHGNTKDLFPFKVSTLPLWQNALLFLWVAVQAPLTEEILFRGVMFQGFLRYFDGRIPKHAAVLAAASLSGVFFGVAHQEIHTLPILIFLGVVLAYVFYYGRSLYASILVHTLINATSLIALFSAK